MNHYLQLKERFMRYISRSFVTIACLFLAAQSAGAQAVTATTHVVITGGPKAGSYDTQTSLAGGCSMGVAGKGIFGVQISDRKSAPDKFNSVQLSVAKPSPTGSSEFMLEIGFGSVMNRTVEYTVETRPTERKLTGKGSVSVKGADAPTPTVSFDATTAAGIQVVGTVSCKSVMRM